MGPVWKLSATTTLPTGESSSTLRLCNAHFAEAVRQWKRAGGRATGAYANADDEKP